MAKLMLSFKGQYLSTHLLDDQPSIIGRDPSCRICIDSLAVAPRNAQIVPSDTGYLLVAMDPDYPIAVNNARTYRARLSNDDLIRVGKHNLTFTDAGTDLAQGRALPLAGIGAAASALPELSIASVSETAINPRRKTPGTGVPAYIQIQSGRNIGRVVAVQRPVTRLGYNGMPGVAIIREEGLYRMLRLEDQAEIQVDGVPLGSGDLMVDLLDGTLIEVNGMRVRFFTGAPDAPLDLST